MKKTGRIILLLVALAIGALYLYPTQTVILKEVVTNTTPDAAFRNFSGYKNLRWWPGRVESDSVFSFQSQSFKVNDFRMNTIGLSSNFSGIVAQYRFSLTQVSLKQTKVTEEILLNLSNNPFTRIQQLFNLRAAKSFMNQLSDSITDFFSKEEKIYGMKIERQKVQDSVLISTKQNFNHYPTTEDIYTLVNPLKAYIKQQGVTERNFPFLNIRQVDSANYEAMVAIATPYSLPETPTFKIKKMVLGNILFGKIKGGLHSIQQAEKQMEYFVFDNKKSSPAIPYQALITDRSQVKDTAAWETGFYYPVFH